ncbi:MAG: EFR1 family ferrodoxin [Eubacteriales bacterium]
MKITAVYFSGTGNTEFIINEIGNRFAAKGCEFKAVNIEKFGSEDPGQIKSSDLIIFGYPIYGSMAPRIIRDFIKNNQNLFVGKTAGVIVTQLLFSGDGGAYLARILRSYGIKVVDIEHFNMPSNLSDADTFKIKNGEANKRLIEAAIIKVDHYCGRILSGAYKRTGDNVFSRGLGLYQRIPFRAGEKYLSRSVKIDSDLCSLCEKCVDCCPMKNLYVEGKKMLQNKNCTLCYRCINLCPQKAISILIKKKPKVQYYGPNLNN